MSAKQDNVSYINHGGITLVMRGGVRVSCILPPVSIIITGDVWPVGFMHPIVYQPITNHCRRLSTRISVNNLAILQSVFSISSVVVFVCNPASHHWWFEYPRRTSKWHCIAQVNQHLIVIRSQTTYTWVHPCTHTHTHTHARSRTHTRTHARTHTHTHSRR